MKPTRDVRTIKQIDTFNVKIDHIGIDRHSYLRTDNPPITNYGFFCIFEGKGKYFLNGKIFDIEKGDVVFIPRGMIYSTCSEPDAPFYHYYLCFNGPDAKSLIARTGFSVDSPVIHTNDDVVKRKLQKIFKLLSRPTYTYIMKANLTLFEIFCYFFQNNKKNDAFGNEKIKYVRQTEDIIHEEYNKGITVDAIARRLKLNRTYLSNIFSTIKGVTIKQYILEYKIDRAKQLIAAGKLSMLQIAQEVGFNDSVNFYRQFKKATLVSPKAFQSQLKQDMQAKERDYADTLRQKKEYDAYTPPPKNK